MDVFIDPRFDGIYQQYPLVLADIGARGGLRPNWQAARRHLQLIGFEPDQHEFNRLVDRARADQSTDRFFGVALHSERGPLHLNVARDRGLTSIFEPNRDFLNAFPDADRFDTVGHQEIDADTLDHVLESHNVNDVDFIKADTQGSELFVLNGAARALASSVVGVEVEVEFTPIYRGQPLFADVDRFMRGLGYLLFDLRPCYWKRAAGRAIGGPHGEIIWADALYLKSVPALREAFAPVVVERQRSKVLKALSVALLYGYLDYALEIATRTTDVWTPDESRAIESRLRSPDNRHDSQTRFPGRRHVAAALRRIWKRLRASNDAWSVSEADLGNVD